MFAPYSVELLLSHLTNDHAFLEYIQWHINHSKKKQEQLFPLDLRYFDL